jgi:hypothetical protein
MPLQPARVGWRSDSGARIRQPDDVRAFVINPRRDPEFSAMVERDGPKAPSPSVLQAALRSRYPRAVVRPRQLEGERAEVWYVYREGTWIAETVE